MWPYKPCGMSYVGCVHRPANDDFSSELLRTTENAAVWVSERNKTSSNQMSNTIDSATNLTYWYSTYVTGNPIFRHTKLHTKISLVSISVRVWKSEKKLKRKKKVKWRRESKFEQECGEQFMWKQIEEELSQTAKYMVFNGNNDSNSRNIEKKINMVIIKPFEAAQIIDPSPSFQFYWPENDNKILYIIIFFPSSLLRSFSMQS